LGPCRIACIYENSCQPQVGLKCPTPEHGYKFDRELQK
jgi:hypothetical protein